MINRAMLTIAMRQSETDISVIRSVNAKGGVLWSDWDIIMGHTDRWRK